MDFIEVSTKLNTYPIYFDSSFDNLENSLKSLNLKNQKICIICDNNTKSLYSKQIIDILSPLTNYLYLFDFKAGEKSKNLATIQNMYDFFLTNHLDRKSIIIALGGGVVGDMAGFAASTYMRGIRFIQIPTTLLAQVDSSVGGKVGVDFKNTKNIIGAFYQPELVYINVNTLKTLPKREFNAGMAEAIKYGMIINRDYYEYINQNKDKIVNMNEDSLKLLIKKACEYKALVVSKDEKESGLREILNFGHTFGHSVETLLDFKLIHGECVALGMIAALYISLKRNIITETEFEEFKLILHYFDLPLTISDIDSKSIYEQMFLDKKVSNDKLKFILLSKIGKAIVTNDLTKAEIIDGINYIIKN